MKSLLLMIMLCCSVSVLSAQDYSFDIPTSETEKKIEWSGNFDGKYSLFHMRAASPFYQLQFFDQDNLSNSLSQYRLELYLNGDYQTDKVGFFLKTHATYYNDSQADFNLFEAYGNLNLSFNTFIQAGKKMYSWGKGYAFNPVGFVNPFKDPENPELAQAGLLSLNFETIKSFPSDILKTAALTVVVIPPAEQINNRYAEIKNTDIAVKSYFLLWDMDLDVMGYYSKLNPRKIGADFAVNLKENLEAHGEFSYYEGLTRYSIENNTLFTDSQNGYACLLGLRFLNRWNTTVIAEYYHTDAGLTQTEYDRYLTFIQNSLSSGIEAQRYQALSFSQSYFAGSTLKQDYVYLKISQPEPFDWLYFTPALFTIYNIQDHSFLLAMPFSYKPVTNFEFLFWPSFLIGEKGSEFGNRQVQQRLELWMRVYF